MATAAFLREVAISAVGKPYVWGANGPDAFDCSGFVLWVWRRCGLDVKDTTAAWLYKMTVQVTGEYRAGDIVTLRNSRTAFNGIGHVAILTRKLANGDWEIVEAKGRAYGVVVTSLSVWKKRAGYQPPRRHPKLILTGESYTPLDFRLVSWNILGRRFDTTKTWVARRPLVISRLKRVLDDTTTAKASILVLTECSATEAAELGKALGMNRVSYLYTTILYSSAWKLGGTWTIENNPGTHGTLIAELTRDGRTINVVASHFPPGAGRAAKRKRLAAALTAKAKGWNDPTLWAGDFNSSSRVEAQVLELGWASTRKSATSRTRADYRTVTSLKSAPFQKGSPLDYVFVRKVTAKSYRLMRAVDPAALPKVRPASDHHPITIQCTVK